MYTLDKIVREFMIEDLGLESIDRRYSRFLSTAVSGLRDLIYDNIGSTEKEVILPVNDNDTVDLPSDYIDYYAIGISVGDELWGLGLNQNLTAVRKDDCGNKLPSGFINNPRLSNDTINSVDIVYYNDRGESLGRNYGVGGGNNSIGEFKVYPERGYIAVSGYSGGSIVLRYKSDIDFTNGDCVVHGYNVEFIKAWLWYKYVSKSRSHNLGQIQLALQAMNKAKKKTQKQHLSFTAREFISAWKSGFKGSPRI